MLMLHVGVEFENITETGSKTIDISTEAGASIALNDDVPAIIDD